MTSDDETTHNGEVLPPKPAENDDGALNQAFLALVNNYTDRPDLLIAEIEKHDPGFVKRMNDASEKDASTQREARFRFGRFQAYLGSIVSVVAAIFVLVIVGLAVWKEQGFGTIVALGLFYAITQGGSVGFSRLIDSATALLSRKSPEDDN